MMIVSNILCNTGELQNDQEWKGSLISRIWRALPLYNYILYTITLNQKVNNSRTRQKRGEVVVDSLGYFKQTHNVMDKV